MNLLVTNFDETISPTAPAALPAASSPAGFPNYPSGRGFVLANSVNREHLVSVMLISEHS
jgi:hypothetical protein